MDLSANLDGLTNNMVAIACQHKYSDESSNVLNNMEKSLYSFTAVKLTNVDSNEIDVLNKFPDTTNAKCEVLDSKNNKNVTEISEQDAIAIMLEAHNTGVGLVIVCDLEPAEFYSESLKSKGISSSIEKED